MALINWTEEFNLGISEIDKQHQHLLGLINKLYDLFQQKEHEDPKEIDRIIEELSNYALEHFANEEHYFQLFGYEKAEEHIKIHDMYRAKVDEWTKRYQASRDKAVFFEISDFLQSWWTWHINNTDRQYVPYLKANGVK